MTQSLAFKKRGKKRFEDYDYAGAIEDFELSLEIVPNEPISRIHTPNHSTNNLINSQISGGPKLQDQSGHSWGVYQDGP